MLELTIIVCILLVASFLADKKKTIKGVTLGLIMFVKLLPALISMLALVSVLFFTIPNETLISLIGKDSGINGWLIAALLGSVSLIPGFIAFPLCNILIGKGVAYSTVAVFITTLMMVGAITLPVEAKFFGWRVSIIRNTLSFIAAIVVGVLMMFFL
ncbi:MAG: hypothetical protein F9K37_05305 [Bacteroidales bacterium]|nr:MAG: hypothetical protein F9K37_05305 [Bacteroidales bacterium]